MAKIVLENKVKINIEKSYLEKLIYHAFMPKGNVLLLLYDEPLPEDNQGVCVAAQLKKFAPSYGSIFDSSFASSWDCCVAISRKWCLSRDAFPAYFTYLVGHELGHARTCLSKIALHIHCCLIHDFIGPASKGLIKFPFELPHELLYDKFGKYVALQLHEEGQLYSEIESLKACANSIERRHLELIRDLSPSNDFSNLRENLIEFSFPYRSDLIDCWKNNHAQEGDMSLTSLIFDYDKLFEK